MILLIENLYLLLYYKCLLRQFWRDGDKFYMSQKYSLVNLIHPIECDNIKKIHKSDINKMKDFILTTERRIVGIRGIVSYKKSGIIVQNAINSYFISYQNISGISSFYYNNKN